MFDDSSTYNKIFEFLSFYFENSIFYWNHFEINEKIIKEINPDIMIDIRTERFIYR